MRNIYGLHYPIIYCNAAALRTVVFSESWTGHTSGMHKFSKNLQGISVLGTTIRNLATCDLSTPYYTTLNSKGAGCIICILKYTTNFVFRHRYTNKKHIHIEFLLVYDITDELCGPVSGLSELIVLSGL